MRVAVFSARRHDRELLRGADERDGYDRVFFEAGLRGETARLVSALRRCFLPQLRKFEELGTKSGKELRELKPLEQRPRNPEASELLPGFDGLGTGDAPQGLRAGE